MIVALIPAREGSKRLPGKNLKAIGRYSLVEWAILAAKESKLIDAIYCSSDSIGILSIAKQAGATPIKRNEKAASDDANDRDVIIDFLDKVHDISCIDLIIYLRPTTPLRNFHDIDRAIERIKAVPQATGLRSVHEMSESAFKCFTISPGDILCTLKGSTMVDSANAPNHLYQTTYHPNGVVDIIRPQVIKKINQTFGGSVIAFITNQVIEIDTEWDLKLALMEFAYFQNYPMEIWRTKA